MPQDLQAQINQLRQDLFDLNSEVYTNNFNASQDFTKYSRFKSRLQVPTFSADPSAGAVGDIVCVGGKLKICTTASQTAAVWTVCGTQT